MAKRFPPAAARLQPNAQSAYRPGTAHNSARVRAHTLPRIGGAYVAAYDVDTHEVVMAGMGRFPAHSRRAILPASRSLGESRTILQALLMHAARRIPWLGSGPRAADQNISARTGSMSSTQGSQRLHNNRGPHHRGKGGENPPKPTEPHRTPPNPTEPHRTPPKPTKTS